VAEVLLFHHAQGLTPGVVAFANKLRGEGHSVHTPDLYGGRIFDALDAGLAYSEQIGVEEIIARGVRAADDLPAELVYIGFSLGVMPAQKLRAKLLLRNLAIPSASAHPRYGRRPIFHRGWRR